MKYLLLPHLRIINANAWSSTSTIGFPAMTAWLGAVHALQRKINEKENLSTIHFSQVGIVSHTCHLQVHKIYGEGAYALSATANPLQKKKKKKTAEDFARPSFIPEPRIHLTVSLLIQCEGLQGNQEECFLQDVETILPSLKMASGDLLDYQQPEILYASEDEEESQKKVLYRLMPGYVLIERRDLLEAEMKQGKDGLDALLSYLSIYHKAETQDGKVLSWSSERKIPGWLVPIGVGFQGISKLGKVENQRDRTKLHQFAENVVTLGEFKMPYRLDSIDEMMWRYEYDETNQLYLCKNEKKEK